MLTVIHSHYRPDAVTRTGVIEPWDIARRNPVDMAQQVVDAFTSAVRPNGPGIFPSPAMRAAAVSTMTSMPSRAQRPQGSGDGTASAQATRTGPNGQVIPQPFRRNMLPVQAAPQGAAGSFVVRDPDGAAVVLSTGATTVAPQDNAGAAVQRSTVMRGPLSNVYPTMMAQRQALAVGSPWQIIRARQDSARDYRAVTLPFKRGI